ncbi:hypothetical protein H1R17_11900 [Flavobacterium sp. xlx-214]|uniref:hypothetical protein n=1 Tax=unclassified Flavobacterium TaxID=196869 RepID=UPI0013D1C08F|nr:MULTISPECIES: hypothetical protein [unclassified Flavobacterium]MBA5794032.1 hypothetical protein [Flavobacterium sp. xlx-221]QMI83153.1 hypothetical protein H1R17_11900 [Flavobacterium sp. xlx-214]
MKIIDKITEVGVALIFFNRPKPLAQVFEALRRIKPKKLFLIQDGARIGNEIDALKIEECRKIVENVDWECEVHRNYATDNLSCDHRVFTGISWAFEFVDRLIILEDDCIPADSFLPFCADVLEKYKDDERIHMISGMNYFDSFNGTDDSYFFSNVAAGWGWATWKRTWDKICEEKNFDYLLSGNTADVLNEYIKEHGLKVKGIMDFVSVTRRLREENLKSNKVISWEYSIGLIMFLYSSMIITPKYNLITNVGLTDDSTHAVNSLKKLDSQTQKLFFKKRFEIEFPLKHPKYVVRNVEYEKLHRKLVGGNGFVRFSRRIESIVRQLVYSSMSERKKMIKKIF